MDPVCECGHPLSEHEEVKNSKHAIQFVCLHIDRAEGNDLAKRAGISMTTICGCSNYKAAETEEQRFKRIVTKWALTFDTEMDPQKGAEAIADAAWKDFNK